MRFSTANLLVLLASVGSLPEALGRTIPHNPSESADLYHGKDQEYALETRDVIIERGFGAQPQQPPPAANRRPNPLFTSPLGPGASRGNAASLGLGASRGGASQLGAPRGGASPLGASQLGAPRGGASRLGAPRGGASPLGGLPQTGRQPGRGAATPKIFCRGNGCGSDSNTSDSDGKGGPPLSSVGKDKEKQLRKTARKDNKCYDPTEQPPKDYSSRYVNYNFVKEPPYGVELSIPSLALDVTYGFQEEAGWVTYSVFSKGNLKSPVVKVSIGTATKGGKKYVAIVAHERFANRDSNRLVMDANGKTVLDPTTKKNKENPNKKTLYVPAWQLVAHAAQLSGLLTADVAKIFLISENIVNDAAMNLLHDMHKQQAPGGAITWTSPPTKPFETILGLDNNHSYMCTVNFNPSVFGNYKITGITSQDFNAQTMSYLAMYIELSKK